METLKKIFSWTLKILKWLFFSIVTILFISAVYNQFLQKESESVEYLSEDQKCYIFEALHLQSALGSQVFPNWSDHSVPVIVYNEKYAFLVGLKTPADGWRKMPADNTRGVKWEEVQADKFNGEIYHRQLLEDPEITPENFTVKVGNRWVATMQTREYAEIAFYTGFKEQLPAVLGLVFPYKLFWNLVMGNSENYIAGLMHESFHAFQGFLVPERLANAENITVVESHYPWGSEQNMKGWIQEADLLVKACKASSDQETRDLIKQVLEVRENRRSNTNLTAEAIEYEKEREWLEGMAKYAEFKSGLLAAKSNIYSPECRTLEYDSDFNNYLSFERYFLNQVEETKRAVGREGENRFYYTGMLQAFLLDRTMKDWKDQIFADGVYLEDLLQKSVQQYANQ